MSDSGGLRLRLRTWVTPSPRVDEEKEPMTRRAKRVLC